MDSPSEHMPLLGPSKLPDRSSRWRLLALICFVVLVQDFAEYIARAPQTEIWLAIVARRFCPGVEDGSGCMDHVQSEVAFLEGWKDTLEQVPGVSRCYPNHQNGRLILARHLVCGALRCAGGPNWTPTCAAAVRSGIHAE